MQLVIALQAVLLVVLGLYYMSLLRRVTALEKRCNTLTISQGIDAARILELEALLSGDDK
jgi:hypothetical protein